ncbi:MAG TPA: hypothetical protein VKE41_00325 [Roseiflexaceae bacterium]|nr:hypothetical protein [Roseiflexaceae bacterium]
MPTPTNGGDPSIAALPTAEPRAVHPALPRARWLRLRTVAAVLMPLTIAVPRPARRGSVARLPSIHRLLIRAMGLAVGLSLAWVAASAYEWGTNRRILPWDPYAGCGATQPAELPATVRIGLYEEFPAPWRLEQLKYVDFPVTLAVAAPSRTVFLKLRETIQRQYPQVREVYFWPLLTAREGYYPGTWSDARAIQRVADDAKGLPVLWDLEMPPELKNPSIASWPENRTWLDQWLRSRTEPVHIWRSHASMGLDPLFLQLVGMHFDPLDYPQVSLHLDLYNAAAGRTSQQMARIMRCGVERYGARFIPALGVLNDGAGKADQFVPPATLRRDLELARAAGVNELWLFGVNGLNPDVVTMLRKTLPLEH